VYTTIIRKKRTFGKDLTIALGARESRGRLEGLE